ncbi:hypothetical protein [Enterococcus durans]|uniref:hypothetical protein n=1 Tax=Enterococcus durans TaxID=53345 RepID=UPI0035DF8998
MGQKCLTPRNKPKFTKIAFQIFVNFGSILFDVGELRQHLFCIKKYRKDTLKSFRINFATNS